MVRELIEVEASGDGWLVRGEGAALSCATKLQAIEQAHTLASRRYVETGRPTAVRVPVVGGMAVIVGACG
ncbi:hypothetical protein FQY83_14170 [Luteimonas marina]|uniref:DUF2188 domain-containing protein n=1 Tax=Luteimonas marina TaxID=488485 RepID=A0A5C5TWC9_9GAMM|nr:hypothetical protein [Luteimonas marina]TWT18521.1 hypothetical protein FQY83_14170 [Luteimonas marina]